MNKLIIATLLFITSVSVSAFGATELFPMQSIPVQGGTLSTSQYMEGDTLFTVTIYVNSTDAAKNFTVTTALVPDVAGNILKKATLIPPAECPECPPVYAKGDANQDGSINYMDYVYMFKYIFLGVH